jgi:hypothetical protein
MPVIRLPLLPFRLYVCLLVSLFLAYTPVTQAWGEFGHRVIGELAERRLSPEARDEVQRLLQGETEPHLSAVAVWADRVREQRRYGWTAPLHYVRIHDRACRYVAARDCPNGECVVGAIERYARELGDTSLDRRQRAEALKFLTHFVADVHQPLHSGHRVDKGGNEFQVNLDGKGTNLHSVWDYHLLASAGRDFDAWIERLLPDLPAAAGRSAVFWAETSCRLTDASGFYPRRPGRLPADYLERHRPIAEKRMQRAAAELAAMIERILGPRVGPDTR